MAEAYKEKNKERGYLNGHSPEKEQGYLERAPIQERQAIKATREATSK